MTLEKNENIVFEKFKAVRALGKGSYGNVYEMYDLKNNESFALKEVPISSENVSSFMAEILPDCVVCHENIQKYHPFVISRRPAILKNLYNRTISPYKETGQLKEITAPKDEDFSVPSLPIPEALDEKNLESEEDKDINEVEEDKVLFEDINEVEEDKVLFEDINEVEEEIVSEKNSIDEPHNWSLSQRIKNSVITKSKKFYVYLKTKICDFSLRDFIDFRNHRMFRMIDDEKNALYDGALDNQVQIPLDLYKKSVKEDKKVNKKFSLGIFRCILLGIIHLHSFGIAHNDIKSSNILLDYKDSFRPKIADFGMKSYCPESHDMKSSESPYNFYDYCSNLSKCMHHNKNKVEDCRALIYILYELLYPCKTQSEMLYLLKDLKKIKKVPKDFKMLYDAESSLIEKVLTDNKITASIILAMVDKID